MKFPILIAIFLSLIFSAVSFADKVRLLEDDVDAALARIEAIEGAHKEILISYYALAHDNAGLMLLASIREARKNNPDLKVKIILDGATNGKFKPAFMQYLADNKIEVLFYCDPFYNTSRLQSWLKPWWTLNRRTHDKLLIVDGKVLITGGRNINTSYFGMRKNVIKEKAWIFIDRDTRVEGDSAAKAREYYMSVWNGPYVSSRKIGEFTQAQYEREELLFNRHKMWVDVWKAGLKKTKKEWKTSEYDIENVEFIHDEMNFGFKAPHTGDRILSLIDSAKESIVIDTPYLVLTKKFERALKRAYDRNPNMKITLVTSAPETSDMKMLDEVTYPAAKKLRKMGVNVMVSLRTDPMHAKALVVDGRWSYVGSFNWVPRSYWGNLESGVIVESEDYAKDLENSITRAELKLVSIDEIQWDPLKKGWEKVKALLEERDNREVKTKEFIGPITEGLASCARLLLLPILKGGI